LRMRDKLVVNILALYKRIMRLQRGLPPELQELGKTYIRDEFKRHKNVGPEEAAVFLSEWANYASVLSQQLSPKGIATGKVGADLSTEQVEHLRDEQIYQLFDLKQESTKPKR